MAERTSENEALRRSAEELIRTGKANLASRDGTDIDSLLHELTVHQVELEAQNENLRQAQMRAEEAELHYSLLFDEAPIGYVILDSDGLIREINRRGEELIGRDKVVGKLFSRYLSPGSLHAFQSHLLACLTATGTHTVEVILSESGDGTKHLLVKSLCLNVPGSSFVRSALVDLTEKKRTEESLRRMNAELEHAHQKLLEETAEKKRIERLYHQAQKLEALGTLAGGIAHDFNNILAAMIGFAELIKDHLPVGSREQDYAQKVLKAGIRGRDLVRQMLTFSRQSEQEKKPLRLSSIVKETARLLRASIPSTIQITVAVKSESGVILGDPVQIQQVVMNLATNAAHAMKEKGGTLAIELSDFSVSTSGRQAEEIDPGLYMKMTVRDTGTGMTAETIERIFDPFFTTKMVGEGTGLGLSVVLGIVKQAGGCVKATSTPGEGSTFDVYFPKVSQEKTDQRSDRETSIPTGHERILLIDDEEALVEMGEEILAELGYEVTSRTNPREALALFRLDASRFDLVITDQTMPDFTGFQLAQQLLAIRPGIPVLLCTGFSHTANDESAKAAGIRGFVMKPLTKRELARTVRFVLDAKN